MFIRSACDPPVRFARKCFPCSNQSAYTTDGDEGGFRWRTRVFEAWVKRQFLSHNDLYGYREDDQNRTYNLRGYMADRSGKDSLYTDAGLVRACIPVEQTPRQSSFRVESSLFLSEPSIRVHSWLFLPLAVYSSTTRRVPSFMLPQPIVRRPNNVRPNRCRYLS
jgi:hypothetical protein